MPLQYERLMSWPFEPIVQSYDDRDTILYALGIGAGRDPLDERELAFVYERDLRAVPTFATVLGYPGLYLRDPDTGIDWRRMLHGEQGLVLHQPLPAAGRVISTNRVRGVVDKGLGRGALVYSERETRDAGSGELIATQSATAFCRADGGFGGPAEPLSEPHPLPPADPDATVDLTTDVRAALIYRLSGDRNPVHVDPGVAQDAGFPRPILHGLCTFGMTGLALLGALCGYRPEAFRRLDVRFSGPVFPGEQMRLSIWGEGRGKAGFRCHAVPRGALIIDNGYFEYEG